MCVIIHRSPGITIPFEKLQSACLVNKDGMGLVAFDRGKLELRKFFEDGGNKAETLQKFLEDAKDLHVYAHLRYRTKGPKDKDNVHPFGVLTKKKHGIDVQFMHNGTMSDFGSDKSCDSKDFAKKFLKPLSEKLLKAVDPKELLHDDSFVTILDEFAGSNSVFLLADSFGGHRIINYDNGKEFAGWWASNDYSFNRYHREPAKTTTYHNSPGYNRRNWNTDENWPTDGWVGTGGSPQADDKKVVTLPAVPNTAGTGGTTTPPFSGGHPHTPKAAESTPKSTVITDAKGNVIGGTVAPKTPEVAVKPVSPTLPQRRLFTEVAEIQDLSDVCSLSVKQIEDLVDEYPEEAVLLIRDLLRTLFDATYGDEEYDQDLKQSKKQEVA